MVGIRRGRIANKSISPIMREHLVSIPGNKEGFTLHNSVEELQITRYD